MQTALAQCNEAAEIGHEGCGGCSWIMREGLMSVVETPLAVATWRHESAWPSSLRGGTYVAALAPAIGAPSSIHCVTTAPPLQPAALQVARAAENTTPGETLGGPAAVGPCGVTSQSNFTSKAAPSGFVAFSVTVAVSARDGVPAISASVAETRSIVSPAGSPSVVTPAMFAPVTCSAAMAVPSTLA